MAHDSLPPPRTATSTSDASLARLYALWFALRAHCDLSVGAPGIEYRERVQTTCITPTTPLNFGRGHVERAPDTVTPRINVIRRRDPDAAATLEWLRGHAMPLPSKDHDADRVLHAALEACALDVAGDERNARWLATAAAMHPVLPDHAPRGERDAATKRRNALVAENRRAWGRKALAHACDVWGIAK